MNVLGISAFYHDSSAALLKNGEVAAAAQEERFNWEKNTSVFPIQAINYCVQESGLTFLDIEAVAYFEKPYLKFARVLLDHLKEFPFSLPSFYRSMPKWLDERLSLPLLVEEELAYKGPLYFVPHHLSHASSAFFASPFEEAAVITVDGVGEWATMTLGTGKGSSIEIERELLYPDSLGMLYTLATVYVGFHANGGEGKTMALASLGEPRFLPALKNAVDVKEDGSFRVDPSYFRYRRGSRMWSPKLEAVLGAPREPDGKLEQRHYDIAASFQALLEEILLKTARFWQKKTGTKNLCLAGGVALNCVANMKILDGTDFERIFVQPAAGDAGGSLGAALYVEHVLHNGPRRSGGIGHAYLGPSFSEREILKALKGSQLPYRKLEEPELVRETADRLAKGKTIAWFQGRMEFGPRSLGNRAILANPCRADMKDHLNERVKKRELFRPFAPIVLEERAHEFFELDQPSPYMLLAPQVKPAMRDRIPAVTHVDGTARVQTVDRASNPRLRLLLEEFEKTSGVPVLLNTSLNRKGEPVVCSPAQAIECFRKMELDCLVVGDFLLEKQQGV